MGELIKTAFENGLYVEGNSDVSLYKNGEELEPIKKYYEYKGYDIITKEYKNGYWFFRVLKEDRNGDLEVDYHHDIENIKDSLPEYLYNSEYMAYKDAKKVVDEFIVIEIINKDIELEVNINDIDIDVLEKYNKNSNTLIISSDNSLDSFMDLVELKTEFSGDLRIKIEPIIKE